MEEILEQAYESYFKSREGKGRTNQPNEGMSEIEDIDNHRYVVLRNVNGILAVFRTYVTMLGASIGLTELEEEDWPGSLKKEG